MIKFENTEVVGWGHAIRGMRNPKNSWERSDSDYLPILCRRCDDCHNFLYGTWDDCGDCEVYKLTEEHDGFMVGPNDHKLMMSLNQSGSVHAKYRRMIVVYTDITAPLYWWKEFDTYKVGTVANSCSTMHKIHEKEFTLEDFSYEHLMNWKDDFTCDCQINEGFSPDGYPCGTAPLDLLFNIISMLNTARGKYIITKDKKYWWQMIQLLPSSYNQKRTVMLNYEVLAGIYRWRKDHKLDEWSIGFVNWIKSLPYSELITGEEQQ